MKVLIITQTVDTEDTILGFFHGWISKFSEPFDSIEVLCLRKGEHSLPKNVNVTSLGKEHNNPSNFFESIGFGLKLLRYAWRYRDSYDTVFVHMNQEYILVAGLLWKILRKPMFLWRNHFSGSVFTDITALFCTKVFCTSKHSYTARYKKTVLMPVGINEYFFNPAHKIQRVPGSILFLSRIAPTKKPDILIGSLSILLQKGADFVADIYGNAIPNHKTYYEDLKKLVDRHQLSSVVSFCGGVPNYETPAIYHTHDIYINLSPSGMFDKTLFEAMACGCIVLSTSKDLQRSMDERFLLENPTVDEVARKLEYALSLGAHERGRVSERMKLFAREHSLVKLSERLFEEMTVIH